MNYEEMKEIADKTFKNARAKLEIEGNLDPFILSIDEASVTPISCKIETDEDSEDVARLMAELAPLSEGIIFVMDSFYREVPKEKANSVPKDLSEDENASDALTCALFMKGKTSLLIAPYLYKDGHYSFIEQSWKECENDKGLFKNPYGKN